MLHRKRPIFVLLLFIRAYGGFASHFPAQAEALLHSLDLSYQKLLYGEASLSNSSSSHSIQSAGTSRPSSNTNSGPTSLPVHPRLKVGSSENLNRLPGIPPRKIAMPCYGQRPGGVINGAAVSSGKWLKPCQYVADCSSGIDMQVFWIRNINWPVYKIRHTSQCCQL